MSQHRISRKSTSLTGLLAFLQDQFPIERRRFKTRLDQCAVGVQQWLCCANVVLGVHPLTLTELSYGNSAWDAKSGESVEDGGTDLNLRDLPIEVARAEALAQ